MSDPVVNLSAFARPSSDTINEGTFKLSGVRKIQFEKNWCEDFFRHSFDTNTDLHMPEAKGGLGIVQGTAILSQISSELSDIFPGYTVSKVEGFSFKSFILHGDVVTMKYISDSSSRVTKALIVTLEDECNNEIFRTRITLTHPRVIKGALRKRNLKT